MDTHVRTTEKLITLVIQPTQKLSKFILNPRHKDKVGGEAGKGGGGQKEGWGSCWVTHQDLEDKQLSAMGWPWYCLPMMQWWDGEEIVRMSFNSGKVGGRGNVLYNLKKSAYTYRRIWQSSSGRCPQCQGQVSEERLMRHECGENVSSLSPSKDSTGASPEPEPWKSSESAKHQSIWGKVMSIIKRSGC